MRNGYVVKKPKNATGYVILPTVYAKGMHAQVDGKEVPVHQAWYQTEYQLIKEIK